MSTNTSTGIECICSRMRGCGIFTRVSNLLECLPRIACAGSGHSQRHSWWNCSIVTMCREMLSISRNGWFLEGDWDILWCESRENNNWPTRALLFFCNINSNLLAVSFHQLGGVSKALSLRPPPRYDCTPISGDANFAYGVIRFVH